MEADQGSPAALKIAASSSHAAAVAHEERWCLGHDARSPCHRDPVLSVEHVKGGEAQESASVFFPPPSGKPEIRSTCPRAHFAIGRAFIGPRHRRNAALNSPPIPRSPLSGRPVLDAARCVAPCPFGMPEPFVRNSNEKASLSIWPLVQNAGCRTSRGWPVETRTSKRWCPLLQDSKLPASDAPRGIFTSIEMGLRNGFQPPRPGRCASERCPAASKRLRRLPAPGASSRPSPTGRSGSFRRPRPMEARSAGHRRSTFGKFHCSAAHHGQSYLL